MKYLLLITSTCFLFSLHAEDKFTNWKSCTKSEECEVVVEICGRASSINRKFLNEFYHYRTEVETKMLCSSILDNSWSDNLKPICKNKKCKIKTLELKANVEKTFNDTRMDIVKLKYSEIEIELAKGNYRECFYKALSLKNLVGNYQNLVNHFYFCKHAIK